MTQSTERNLTVAIACGGTGGHLFPGIAVGRELVSRGCAVTLLISNKEVDRQAAGTVQGMRVESLGAVGLELKRPWRFVTGFARSYRQCQSLFQQLSPAAVLAMGGFTSAPPILSGRRRGAATFLHESNAIPGRANRWLAPWVDHAFVGFAAAQGRMRAKSCSVVGTPVREEFFRTSREAACASLGLRADQPVLAILGGSQGARGVNDLVTAAAATLLQRIPGLQVIHSSGTSDFERVKAGCGSLPGWRVEPFIKEMHLVLAAADVAISRSGASSLAELAAAGVPTILIPFPHATDNHQHFNSLEWVDAGAGIALSQSGTSPQQLSGQVVKIFEDRASRLAMSQAARSLAHADAAVRIAELMLKRIEGSESTKMAGLPDQRESTVKRTLLVARS